MKRVTAFFMTACLISLQAHGFVPHHHHSPGMPDHAHAYPAAFDGAASSFLTDLHPELVPHDEDQAVTSAARSRFDLETPSVIPDAAPPVILSGGEAVLEPLIAPVLPYSTGPPGTRSPRAPPTFLAA